MSTIIRIAYHGLFVTRSSAACGLQSPCIRLAEMHITHPHAVSHRPLVFSRTVKLVSLGRAGSASLFAGEEGVPEVRASSFLAAEVPKVLEDGDGRHGRLYWRHRWHRRRQRRQGLRLAQHLVEPLGPYHRQLRAVASCSHQCGYQRCRHVTAEQSQQPDRRL